MTDTLPAAIRRLCEGLVLAAPGDLQDLAAFHAVFKEAGESRPGGGADPLARLCMQACALLEGVVLGESADPARDLAGAAGAAAVLQAVLCEGRDLREVLPATEAATPEEGRPGNPAETDTLDPDPELLPDFVREALEHLDAADVHLMALESGTADGEALNAVFRGIHTIKGVAGFLGLRALQAFAHQGESLLDRCRAGELPLDRARLDVIFAAVDALKRRIRRLSEAPRSPLPPDLAADMEKVMGQVMASAAGVSALDAAPAPPAAAPAAPAAPEAPTAAAPAAAGAASWSPAPAPPRPGEAAPAAPVEARPAGESAAPSAAREVVKVEADRLDRLLDAIGELVIAESMILQSPELRNLRSASLAQRMGQLDKITRDLQQMGTSLRMGPIRPMFQKMARLVRDLSRKAGKEVEFACSGEETELDRTVLDRMGDPLVHMVRNSVDHGIESDPALRTAAGKPARARVRLSAFQKGGSVCIRIQDDGKGLDREAILRKARDRGLLHDDGAALPDREVWDFIFQPGFSTAAQVTEISGRGVGMDVVKRSIEELRGRIDIESRRGEGTAFSIWLPLTLAIIDGMIVRLGGQRFVFPTLSILRIVPLRPESVRSVAGRGEVLRLQDELIPLLRLEGLLPGGSAGPGGGQGLAVIVESGGRKAGLPVDELLGQQQVVIKGLGEALKQVPGLSGGAILPDGTVGLILDVDGLLKAATAEAAAA